MAETLFPQRQRCKACRKALGQDRSDPVFHGLFCSTRCAGMAPLPKGPGQAPRECVTQRDGRWTWKRRHRCEEEVPDKILEDPSTKLYRCSVCAHLHAGHTRMGEAEKFRMLTSPADLADLLIKLRGKATVRQVAKAAGVQPIRLKELEEPKKGQRVDLPTLFAVLDVLGARPGVAIRGGR